MDFFVWNPGRIAVVAGAFLVAFLGVRLLQRANGRFRSTPLLVTAALWGLYALWEWRAMELGLDIRVDLLVIYPVLLIVSVAALLLAYRWRRPST
jgi:hypothetical protein